MLISIFMRNPSEALGIIYAAIINDTAKLGNIDPDEVKEIQELGFDAFEIKVIEWEASVLGFDPETYDDQKQEVIDFRRKERQELFALTGRYPTVIEDIREVITNLDVSRDYFNTLKGDLKNEPSDATRLEAMGAKMGANK